MSLVTVYLPTKDRPEMLQRAVASVLDQSYKNLELIIVDDGSLVPASSTLQHVDGDPRIRLFRFERSVGAAAARNKALSLARGEYITGLDDDDWFVKTHIELAMRYFSKEYAFVAPNYLEASAGQEVPRLNYVGVVPLEPLIRANLVGNQVLTLTSRLRAVGGFDERLSAMIDWEAWLRLIMAYGSGYRYSECTYVFRNDPVESYERISRSPEKVIASLQHMHAKHVETVGAGAAAAWLQYAAFRAVRPAVVKAIDILRHATLETFWLALKLSAKAMLRR